MKRFLIFALPCALMLDVCAADFPSKLIRMVVPFGPGSNSDVLARTVAVRMAETWGQQVVVDNRSGAGGSIGANLVAKAPADGYTIARCADLVGDTPEQFAQYIRTEAAKWGRVIKALNLKID